MKVSIHWSTNKQTNNKMLFTLSSESKADLVMTKQNSEQGECPMGSLD